MSQEKVDRYKERKANRKEILAREKRNRRIVKASGILIALALVGWLGYSVYDKVSEPVPVEIDSTAFDEYLTGLQTAE